MDKVELSIITPFYNVRKDIFQNTINSVLPVLCDNWEWIIVLHNTTNVSVQDIHDMTNNVPQVKVFEKKDNIHSPSSPRNYGLDKVNGKYVYFLDSDDEVEDNFFSNVLNKMDKDNLDIVFMSAHKNFHHDQIYEVPLELLFPKLDEGYIVTDDPVDRGHLIYGSATLLATKIFRMDIIRDSNLRFDESLCLFEDNLFSLEYCIKAKKICILGNVYSYTYIQHSGSLLQNILNNDKYGADSCIEPIQKIFDTAKNNNISAGTFLWSAVSLLYAMLKKENLSNEDKQKIQKSMGKFLPYLDKTPPKGIKTSTSVN